MSWKQMLEVKPETEVKVETAVASGDPCCETARDKFLDLYINSVSPPSDRTYKNKVYPRMIKTINKLSCDELKKFLDYLIEDYDAATWGTTWGKNFGSFEELIKIRDEWEECDSIE